MIVGLHFSNLGNLKIPQKIRIQFESKPETKVKDLIDKVASLINIKPERISIFLDEYWLPSNEPLFLIADTNYKIEIDAEYEVSDFTSNEPPTVSDEILFELREQIKSFKKEMKQNYQHDPCYSRVVSFLNNTKNGLPRSRNENLGKRILENRVNEPEKESVGFDLPPSKKKRKAENTSSTKPRNEPSTENSKTNTTLEISQNDVSMEVVESDDKNNKKPRKKRVRRKRKLNRTLSPIDFSKVDMNSKNFSPIQISPINAGQSKKPEDNPNDIRLYPKRLTDNSVAMNLKKGNPNQIGFAKNNFPIIQILPAKNDFPIIERSFSKTNSIILNGPPKLPTNDNVRKNFNSKLLFQSIKDALKPAKIQSNPSPNQVPKENQRETSPNHENHVEGNTPGDLSVSISNDITSFDTPAAPSSQIPITQDFVKPTSLPKKPKRYTKSFCLGQFLNQSNNNLKETTDVCNLPNSEVSWTPNTAAPLPKCLTPNKGLPPLQSSSEVIHPSSSTPKHHKLEEPYSKHQPLLSYPSPGDEIAFKVLELSESYCPQMSAYKRARVVSVDNNKATFEVEILSEEKQKVNGKFDLEFEDNEEEIQANQNFLRTYQWAQFIEPKLLCSKLD